ncbi:ornithine cyclodeaminase family protein [Kribbella turkmenica]|uniref:Ornithine cyclodeaminase family protein n=1 Tax=Kribbella turkmenica TaxID=2530375 RepID=A0A4R4X4C4_9ACTN|nr:ornithine cyclodeaminase family protein [Kribbella turkmenica]TDD25171.1 ornithine cyclodeaminase family protein [Kribbella turkmenica]
MTLLLTRSDILGVLDPTAILDTLRAGFHQPAPARPIRSRTDLPGPGTATALLPGVVQGVPAYTVKVNAKFPAASPALRGVVCLHDLADGSLLALMDSATITAWRTGLAVALATDLLATRASTVGVIGAGAQAAMVLRGLTELRDVTRVVVHDLDLDRSAAFLANQAIPGQTAQSPSEVAADADLVVLATWSRKPLLTAADARPGLHLTTVGADEPGKVELSAELLLRARVIVDDLELAVGMGALGNAGLGAEAAHGTLTQVLTGSRTGRETADQLTVYAPVGLPWQDLAIAWPVYQAAVAAGNDRAIDFLS